MSYEYRLVNNEAGTRRLRIEEALGTCLLPSLQLIPANPAVGQEIWEVMSLLPYEVGFRSAIFNSFVFGKFFLHGRHSQSRLECETD